MIGAPKPFCFFDAPEVLDASVTTIPASSASPLQVIASSPSAPGAGIQYSDSTGEFIGVYLGAPGSERLLCILGGGVTSVAWGRIPGGSRVSLRSMTNNAITSGKLAAVLVTE
jgi:hypothetical protein